VGDLYVADEFNSTIRKITPAGAVTTLAGSAGTPGSVDGIGAAAWFYYPQGVAVDGAGNVYVADTTNCTIRKITPSGQVTTLAGTAGQYGSADGTGTAARFNFPLSVAADGAGNVYVADTTNQTIREVTPGGVVTTLAGAATTGSSDGIGTNARFYNPEGVAIDSVGNVYVADGNNDTIRELSIPSVLAQSGLTGSGPVAIGAPATGLMPGTTYYYRVVATSAGGTAFGSTQSFVTLPPPAATTQTATTVTGTGATLNATVNPSGFTTAAIFQYSTDPGLAPNVTTLAGTAGQQGSIDGTGAAARFAYPSGVAMDSAGNVYVADQYNDTIRKITPDGVVTTLAGLAGYTGSADGTGTAARFNHPSGVAVDGAGNVYVADTNNDTIRKVTPGGVVTTLAGAVG
jgi:hypothetical protein